MIKLKHFTLVLFIGVIWGKPIEIDKKVNKYSSENDYFSYDDSLMSVIGVSDLLGYLIVLVKEYLITKKDMNMELIQKMAQVVW